MNHNTNKEIVTDEKKLLHDFMQRLFSVRLAAHVANG